VGWSVVPVSCRIFSLTCRRPRMKLIFASIELADAQELFRDGGGRPLMAGMSV